MAHLSHELAEVETEIPDFEIEEGLDDGADYEEEFLAPQGFQVHDEASANWVIRKIAESRGRAARLKAMKKSADAEIKSAQKSEAFFMERFGAQLAEFAQGALAGGKRKSLRLLEGSVGFRKQSARLEITDEDAAITWAQNNCGGALKIEISVRKSELLAHFERTGEVPDGCEFVPEAEVLYVK